MGNGNSTSTGAAPPQPEMETPSNYSSTTVSMSDSVDPNKEAPSTPQKSDPSRLIPHVPPGYILFGCSLPFYMRAYHLYHYSPLDTLVGRITEKNQITMADLKNADINIRRAVGFSVAGRALRIANLVSVGSFGMFGAAVFFVGGWNSLQDGVTATRRWAYTKRKALDNFLGVEERVDEDHPDMIARRNMTREEEAKYLAERYWIVKKPAEDETEEETSEE